MSQATAAAGANPRVAGDAAVETRRRRRSELCGRS